jgi:L-asparaginase/Glu-tRNA(Gln) amidotransferase subunit D
VDEQPNRRAPLSNDDIERISSAVALKIKSEGFHIDEETHYNQHREMEKFLDAYNNAQSSIIKGFWLLVGAGALVLAAIGVSHSGLPK